MNDAVVTGIGTVNALGVGFDCFVEALREGESGVRDVDQLGDAPPRRAAIIDDFDVEEFLPSPKNYLDRDSELAFGALALALEDANLNLADVDKSRVGLFWATSHGGLDTMNRFFSDVHAKGPRFAKPILFPHAYANTAISLLSVEYGLSGPHLNFTGGWDAGSQAVVAAIDMIRDGSVDSVFVGASAALGETSLKYLAAPSRTPTSSEAIIPGEAATVLLLESSRSAQARDARSRTVITGTGMARDAKAWRDGNGAALLTSIRAALSEAERSSADVPTVVTNISETNAMVKSLYNALAELHPKELAIKPIHPLTGATFAVDGLLQIAAAAAETHASLSQNALIVTLDPGGNTVAIVIRAESRGGRS